MDVPYFTVVFNFFIDVYERVQDVPYFALYYGEYMAGFKPAKAGYATIEPLCNSSAPYPLKKLFNHHVNTTKPKKFHVFF